MLPHIPAPPATAPALQHPQCSACRRALPFHIRLYDHAAGVTRVAKVCGQHARPVRAMNRTNSAFTILEIYELQYVAGGPNADRAVC